MNDLKIFLNIFEWLDLVVWRYSANHFLLLYAYQIFNQSNFICFLSNLFAKDFGLDIDSCQYFLYGHYSFMRLKKYKHPSFNIIF